MAPAQILKGATKWNLPRPPVVELKKVGSDENSLNCEKWFDGCSACPVSELRSVVEGGDESIGEMEQKYCTDEKCDESTRQTPYCMEYRGEEPGEENPSKTAPVKIPLMYSQSQSAHYKAEAELEESNPAPNGMTFCADSPVQVCRMLCTSYPTCNPDSECLFRKGTCCNFECHSKDSDASSNDASRGKSGVLGGVGVSWGSSTLLFGLLIVLGAVFMLSRRSTKPKRARNGGRGQYESVNSNRFN